MPRLTAAQAFNYAGRDLAAGEEFDASEKDATILVGVGKAKRPATIETRALDATDAMSDPAPAGQRRRYNRADMRAKE